MDKRFGLILLIVVALIGGIFIFTKKDSPTNSSDGTVSNHSSGAGTANVDLVEYGDFQCPACSSFFQIVEQVRATYGDQIKFTFRNFPLVSIHKNAMASHRAAEAAAAQGKFFEMYEMLYQDQSA
jgi:protein-disulfide isomerase